VKKLATLLCTTAVAVTALSSADARTLSRDRTLSSKGYWRAYEMTSDKNSTICGMETGGKNSALIIKAQPDTHGLWIRLFKTSWKFPKDGVDVPLVFMLDNDEQQKLETTARGYMSKGDKDIAMVEFEISGDTASQFLDDVARAGLLTVTFKEGNEQTWSAKMDGSREAAAALKKCAAQFPTFTADPSVKPTQPYSEQSTQPYSTDAKKKNTI
jgi:hypothetical protein